MDKKTVLISLLFFTYLLWWLLLLFVLPEDTPYRDYFTDTYGVMAFAGGALGLYISKAYGGFGSFVGKSLVVLALGLLAQFLGQLSYTVLYYVYGIENAYPSFGEGFYLLSIPLYLIGIAYLARSSGISLSLKTMKGRFWALLLPFFMVIASYYMFLRGYDYIDQPFVNVFLDFVYPIGQSLFVSFALLTLVLTKDVLGGIMRKKVVLLLLSLVFQFLADTLFIHETRTETWMPAGNSDILFVFSYYIMALAFVQFSKINEDLKKINFINK